MLKVKKNNIIYLVFKNAVLRKHNENLKYNYWIKRKTLHANNYEMCKEMELRGRFTALEERKAGNHELSFHDYKLGKE